MKRDLLFIFLIFAILGSVIYAPVDDQITPNIIDSTIASSRNYTYLELEYYPNKTNIYSIQVNMYQAIVKKIISSDDSEALNPEQFFNRDYVPDGLKVSLYETKYINDKITECIIKNSKCNLELDLSKLPDDYFSYGCLEIYAEFEGNDDLKSTESSSIYLCRDKNTKVAEAFEKTVSDELSKSENQTVCLLFFIFIGFLFSSLYASGGNPLRYFDINTPRLPGSKQKIKFDPNSKDNEILKGRQMLRAIKKNLDMIQVELLKEIEKLAKKNFEKTINEKAEYKTWSTEKKMVEVKRLTKEFMNGINKKLNELLSLSNKEIISETNKLKGVESIKREIEIKLETNNKVKELLDSKLKEVSDGEQYSSLSPKIDLYHKQSKALIRSELTVDMRSMILRGSASGKRIGSVRKVVESIPILSGISLGASALLNKNISPEFQVIRYAADKVIGSYDKRKNKQKVNSLVNEIENPELFYNKKSSQNMTELEKTRLDALKNVHENIRKSLQTEEEENKEFGNLDKVEVLKELIIKEHNKVKTEVAKSKKEFEDLMKDNGFTDDEINKLLKPGLSSKDLVKLENELKKYEFSDEVKKSILTAHKKLLDSVLLEEKIAEEEKIISTHKTEGAVLTPDTTINDVISLISLKNLTNDLKNVPCSYLKNKIEEKLNEDSLKDKLKEFDKEYGELVLLYNPNERFDKLIELSKKYGVSDGILNKSKTLMDEIRKLNYYKSETTGYIEGYRDILDFTDKLVKEYDFIELGIMDTLQDQKSILKRYLETYGAFDSDIDGQKLSDVLKTKGFNEAVGLIVKKIGDEEKIGEVYDIEASHAPKMFERTEKNKEIYAMYINFFDDFDETLRKFNVQLNDKRIEKLREFYADSMCEIYEEGKYPDPENLSHVFNPEKPLTEDEIHFKERAERIFNVLDQGLNLQNKSEIIKHLKKLIDTAPVDAARIKNEISQGLHTELLGNLSGKSITSKWLHDSSLHRAEAITVPAGLRENILKLRDYVEDNVVTYNNLVDRATQLNNEKRDRVLYLNYKLGNIVKDTSNLTGQQIFAEMSTKTVGILGTSLDLYFRETFEEPRLKYLEKEFKMKVSSHLIYDLVEGRFDKVRKNLGLDGVEYNNYNLEKIRKNLSDLVYDNMYNRVLYRGWESFESEIINETQNKYNIKITNVYDLYDLLDGNTIKFEEKYNINNAQKIRESILNGKKDTYDLMKSKGVEFLIGGNNPTNLEEVYYVYKAYNKFSAVKDDKKLLGKIKDTLKSEGIDKSNPNNILSFFDDVAHEGLILQGMELTAEGERRFGWHIDIKSNYTPLHELGTKKRSFEILKYTFNSLLDGSDVNFDDINNRKEYIENLKGILKEYDSLDLESIKKELKSKNIFSEKLAQNILNYKEFFIRYDDATDYVPSYNTVGITGKAVNVRISDNLIQQDDGSFRRIIVPCDEDTKIRRFSYDLQNEVNKCFVTFPMIGLMSESVSTFNTIFRSKDYVSQALENYKSFSSTNVNDLVRNEEMAKLLVKIYEEKWACSTMCDKNIKIEFNPKELKIEGKIESYKELMRKEIINYFTLENINFDDAVKNRKDQLEKLHTLETDKDKRTLYLKELNFLNEKYDNYKLNSKKLDDLKSSLKDITTAISRNSKEDIEKSFDVLINGLTPFAGEYHVKDNLDDSVSKRKYYVDYELQKIDKLKKEIKFYLGIEKKIVSEIKSKFKNIPKGTTDDLITYLKGIDKKSLSNEEKDYINDRITHLNNLSEIKDKLEKKIESSNYTLNKISYTVANKKDLIKVNENHLKKAKELSDSDIKFDILFRTSSILFENFTNTYEGLYKTRNLSTHTRRVAYGLPGNEFGGTQFAGPISSTPLQYFGTLGQTGNRGWFSVLSTSFLFHKIDKLYKKRFAFNYLFSDVPLITSPMGVYSRMQVSKYYKIKFGIMKGNFGEYLEPYPHEKPAPTLSLISSLFSKNIRGETRLKELMDFMGGSYLGTPKGARDVINYILYKPSAMKMDFKDRVFTLQDSRSMKKSSEFLYDIGIYAPLTNNSFIAGREITLFNDLYYNQTSNATFYPNRAMNLLSSAPHYGNPKYRNMAYNGFYKFTQSQLDLVNESIYYTDLGKTPMWNLLSIPLLPLLIGTSGIPFYMSLFGFSYINGLRRTLQSSTINTAIKVKEFFKPEDYYVKKYSLYTNKGLYSSAYNSNDENNNNK